ncbi:hypothetical protein [Abyssalbus ytuae]|uniref:Uncharacterized protein n=1 Tax=Abyssalbus ytuae TaxID=2926907 RepID=A0A9E6ZNN4_9FLAO|nr:hypothetical protein [Abyssalbus ytuae]UOB19274.1 hypothetical protein MQE35_08235 [Abyssalbus ytuae]
MIGQIVVLGGSIYYLIKKKGIEGWLMMTGTLLGLLVGIFQQYIFPFILTEKNINHTQLSYYYSFFFIISALFSLIFAVGFIILIIKNIQKV